MRTLAAVVFLLLAACRGPETPPPPKGAPTPFPVAFVYAGAPGDQGWVDAQEVARGARRPGWTGSTPRSAAG